MKINIALIILFSQIHFMGGDSAQKVTYIHLHMVHLWGIKRMIMSQLK